MLLNLISQLFLGSRSRRHHAAAKAAADRGAWDDAIAGYHRAISARANNTEAYNDLGIAHAMAGECQAARNAFKHVLDLDPIHKAAHLNLAHLLREQFGDCEAAAHHYRKVLQDDPDSLDAWRGLGLALSRLGKAEAAVAGFSAAIQQAPADALAFNDFGITLAAARRFSESREAFLRALEADPDLAPAHLNLAHLLRENFHDYAGATQNYRAALNFDAAMAEAWRGLGLSLAEQGNVHESIRSFEEALKIAPTDAEASEFRLFVSNALPERDLDFWFNQHKQWGDTQPVSTYRQPDSVGSHTAQVSGRNGRIRVGYVSGDFREHATARFLLPLLDNHNRNIVEIHCYSNSSEQDYITDRIRRNADFWTQIESIDDDKAAEKIRTDEIDVLVDLSGHTRGNRLGVFARKPARIQISYLGYLNTTGLRVMDYRLTDSVADPGGTSELFHTERLLRLPDTMWCWEAPTDAPAESSLPGLRRHYTTFGSFNHAIKLNDTVIDLWANILTLVKNSRLTMVAIPDDNTRSRILHGFKRAGIAESRLSFLPRLTRAEYWAAIQDVDISFDPFPYTGGATTLDSLWMGVPVIALAGAFGFSRSSASVLVNAGCSDFLAHSKEAYVEIATRLGQDFDVLAKRRSGLRKSLGDSPIMNASCLAADVEKIYKEVLDHAMCVGKA